ncbi:MAG: AMP-binding protein [Gemmatimonadaceae bacterium]|nr:AMP-binding protein [Gemmatimonadaceae bacterium]
MDLLPLRAAAGGGSIDGQPAAALVAAGFTLLQRCPALVRALAGKRAAILLPTCPQFLTALAASDGRGSVLVNPLASPFEVGHQALDASVGAVFTIASLQHKLAAGLPRVLLDEAPRGATFLSRADDPSPLRLDLGSHFGLDLEGDADSPGRDEECAIVYTSAMQGRPLGAVLTHRNLITNARQTVQAAAQSPDDHLLAVLPFSHLFGLTVSLMAPLFAAARVTTMPRFNALTAVDTVEREGITEIVGVPSVFAGMLAAIERRGGRFDAQALRLCICGGAPLSVGLQERWLAATGVELRQGYGLTEASPVALFNAVQHENVHGALGLPFPGLRVSIREPESGAECPVGNEGEICVAGDTVFRGYVGEVGPVGSMRPVPATARANSAGLRTRDGWLHSGDRGQLREDGRVEFRGLYKPMFTRNGFNIYPAEIEGALSGLPGVLTARVVAVPDATREHEIALEIVAMSDDLTEDAVKAWCGTRLSQYKQPSRIAISRQA